MSDKLNTQFQEKTGLLTGALLWQAKNWLNVNLQYITLHYITHADQHGHPLRATSNAL
jgi:hypothetical protein